MQEYKFTDDIYFNELSPTLMGGLYLHHIFQRVHRLQFNHLGFFTGKHRVGKSLTSLGFSYVLDPTFVDNMENRIVYYADDFMAALESLRKKNIIGGTIVWDEAGVGIPAREWYNISNKAISIALQVFGYLRPIVFFVTQDPSYIDSSARKLFHSFYETSRIDNKYASIKPFNVSYDKKTGKIYYIYSRISIPNGDALGVKGKLKHIHIKRPPSELEKKYNNHSREFKDIIMEQMKERTELMKQGKLQKKTMTVSEIISDLVNEHKEDDKYLSKRSSPDNVIFDPQAIRFMYDVPDAQARFIKKQAEVEANKIEDLEESNS